MEDADVVARARLEEKDYHAYARAANRQGRAQTQLLALVYAVPPAVDIAGKALGGPGLGLNWLAHGLTIAGAVFFASLVLTQPAQVAKQLVKLSTEETTYRVGAEGVSTADALSIQSYRWPRFGRVVELRGLYALELQPGFALLLPKRAFASPEDERAFRLRLADRGILLEKGRDAWPWPAP